MNALWSYFWPCLAAGVIVGGPAGTIAFRRRAVRTKALAIGAAISITLAALWHGPFGGADRFAAHLERALSQILTYYEMTQVSAHVQHGPLARQVQLSGPADGFQRSELVRLIDQYPGVAGTSWSNEAHGIPLIVEGAGVALLGFLFGLLLAYLVELHRRYNAQWNW
jgi:hypothetical protein